MRVNFVVIGGGYYGTAETVADAKRNFSRVGGRLAFGYGIFEFGPDSEYVGIHPVYGSINYRGAEPVLIREVKARARRKSKPDWAGAYESPNGYGD